MYRTISPPHRVISSKKGRVKKSLEREIEKGGWYDANSVLAIRAPSAYWHRGDYILISGHNVYATALRHGRMLNVKVVEYDKDIPSKLIFWFWRRNFGKKTEKLIDKIKN